MSNHFNGCFWPSYPCDLSSAEEELCSKCSSFLVYRSGRVVKFVEPKTMEQIREEYFAELKKEAKLD